jgi:hypothetical protein
VPYLKANKTSPKKLKDAFFDYKVGCILFLSLLLIDKLCQIELMKEDIKATKNEILNHPFNKPFSSNDDAFTQKIYWVPDSTIKKLDF